jgi:hypothetical protein
LDFLGDWVTLNLRHESAIGIKVCRHRPDPLSQRQVLNLGAGMWVMEETDFNRQAPRKN